MNSVKLEEIKDILTEEGFTIFGHGTGGNNIEAVGSIFDVGLRASHTSVFYTTIVLWKKSKKICKKLFFSVKRDAAQYVIKKSLTVFIYCQGRIFSWCHPYSLCIFWCLVYRLFYRFMKQKG